MAISQSQQTVPGLTEYFRRGFDIGAADFTVFDYIFEPFSFSTHDSVEGYGPADSTGTFAVTDSVSVLLEIQEEDTLISRYISTSQEYDDTFSIDVSGGGSYAGFSASASSSYFDHDHLKQSRDSAFTEDFHAVRIYRAERREEMALSSACAKDMQSLPTTLTDSTQEVYNGFFRKWGTHYLEAAEFGGFVRMTTSATKSFLETESDEKVTGAVHAAFTSTVASGSLDINTVKTNLKDIKETDIEWDSSLVQVGGNELDTTGKWADSLFAAPQPLIGLPTRNLIFSKPTFKPIAELAPAELQQTMTQALEAYIAGFARASSPGTPTTVHPDTVQQADGDGLLVASVGIPTGQSGSSSLRLIADASMNPQQERASASVCYEGGSDDDRAWWIQYASATSPVKRGEYYLMPAANQGAVESGLFLPFPSGVRLGTPNTVVFATREGWTATSDGLLVVDLTYETPTDAGNQTLLGTSAGQIVAGCSVGRAFQDFDGVEAYNASFCMPVRDGTQYNVTGGTANEDPGPVFASGQFFPFLGTVFPNGPEEREIDRTYSAQSDGLLFGHVHCDNGPRGSLLVHVGEPNADPLQRPVLQAASVHRWDDENIAIQEASVMVPLAKDQTYHVESQWTVSTPRPSLFWIDLAPPGA